MRPSTMRTVLLLACMQACLALISKFAVPAPRAGVLLRGMRGASGRQPGRLAMPTLRRGRARVGGSGSAGILAVAATPAEPLAPAGMAPEGYLKPPKEIADLVEANVTPQHLISPPATGSKWFAKLQQDPMLSLADLAEPEERLAGLRFMPHLCVPSRRIRSHTISIVSRQTGEETPVQGLPAGALISGAVWSPLGDKLAINVLTREDGVRLYMLDPETPVAKPVTKRKLSGVSCGVYEWLPAAYNKVIVNTVPDTRGPPPERPRVPAAPTIQETSGTYAPSRTLQDLLQDEHDDALFEYHTTSQLVEVDLVTGAERLIGPPMMNTDMDVSPDGRFLITKTLQKPFSRQLLFTRFETRYDVWSLHEDVPTPTAVVTMPMAESVPIGVDACRPGKRAVTWCGNEDSTLMWIEALDGGDPKADVKHRDAMYKQEFPIRGEPQELIRTQFRMQSIWWGQEGFALLREMGTKVRTSRMWQINTKSPSESPKEPLLEYESDDSYGHPGHPVTFRNERNKHVLKQMDDGAVLMTGRGGSEEGDRPFMDKRKLYGNGAEGKNAEAERLWRCDVGVYEIPLTILPEGKDGGWVLMTSRESQVDVPNVWETDLSSGTRRQVTFVEHPQPALLGVQKQLIKYTRSDGLELSGMLYLPAGYKIGEKALPTLLWAYPQEFKSSSSAAQVQGSPHTFILLPPMSPVLWVARGYAVLDDPAMPIVGEGGKEENDMFVPQLVASAEAAVNKLRELGVSDDRIAVGGHSYGAFMTANLLAHSKLFKAGIGRSGAYNRLLTPFGFQSEERTLWEAPEAYLQMSPFLHADKIEAPMLMIHGEADDNTGTFPMQSERLFQALKGLGKTARLCILPLEAHSYSARESLLHMCWEMDRWLEQHLK